MHALLGVQTLLLKIVHLIVSFFSLSPKAQSVVFFLSSIWVYVYLQCVWVAVRAQLILVWQFQMSWVNLWEELHSFPIATVRRKHFVCSSKSRF